MYKFLLRPRWIAGHVLLVVTVITFVTLGFWQLRRLDERRAHNTLVTQRLQAAPVPLDELLRTVGPDVDALEYRRVTVSGRYRSDAQVLTGPRSRDGRPGPQVLTVLQPDGAAAVLVDRGWVPFDRAMADPPSAPAGEVRVEGIVRAPESGDAGDGDFVARIVPSDISRRLGVELPAFYVELWDQQPPDPGAPLAGRPPELSEGSHQSYALQWFSFALIALFGYPVLVRHVARQPDDVDGDGDPDGGDGAGLRRNHARIP